MEISVITSWILVVVIGTEAVKLYLYFMKKKALTVSTDVAMGYVLASIFLGAFAGWNATGTTAKILGTPIIVQEEKIGEPIFEYQIDPSRPKMLLRKHKDRGYLFACKVSGSEYPDYSTPMEEREGTEAYIIRMKERWALTGWRRYLFNNLPGQELDSYKIIFPKQGGGK